MRKFVGLVLGMAIAGAASIASAQNVQGTVEEIDPVAKTIIVDGDVFQMPDATTAGTPLEELKVGDKVDIMYNPEEGSDEDSRYRAMQVEKIQE